MKKIILAAALALAVSVPFAAHAEFADMSGCDEEMRTAVTLLTENGYVKGRSDSEFEPDGIITRAEFAAVMLRMMNYMGEVRPYYLKDVPKKAWYYYVAGSAAETGIMSGFEDGTFRGDEPIKKVQALVIISRILTDRSGITAADCELNYDDAYPEWAKDSICIAVNGGIIGSEGSLGAESDLTRGEAARLTARLFNKIENTGLTPYTGSYEMKKPPVTIVIDAGHGADSWKLSDDERRAEGWLWNEDKGQWGEWRHWKSHTTWQDCCGSGCSGRVTPGGSCWYRMENGDRGDKETVINMNNAKSAAEYLEKLGYDVRLSRSNNTQNPSMTKRLIYCYPNNDISAVPDADLFVCLHSNAGGGRGSAYIELSGTYDQAGIPKDYTYIGNTLGKYINDEIAAQTSMSVHGSGKIEGEPQLVLFCKCPVPIAYMEIGFFDNSNDLYILNTEYDAIGKAIADGIDKYCKDAGI